MLKSLHPVVLETVVVGDADGVDGPAVVGGATVDVVLIVVVLHTLQSPQVLGQKLQRYDWL